jgi:hypothetical protein
MKRTTTSRCFFLAAFLFAFSLAHAQTALIIPQIVDGGAWLTTIALTNTSASQAVVSLNFFQETGGGNTSSWPLNFVEMTSAQTQDIALPGGSSVFLHTLGTAAATTIGWAQLSETSASVVAYAIFTQRVPGRSDQDGTAPAAAAISRILVPFDNTNGAVTSMAIANTTQSSESISVGIRSASTTTQATAITLPADGHESFTFPTQFPTTAGQSGLAEFYAASGSFSILALKFNSGAFTTAPVYSATGPPIIISSSSGGGSGNIIVGSFPLMKINTSSASLPPATGSVVDQIAGGFASYSPAEFQLAYPAATFGPCGVVDSTYPILGKAPDSADSFLDAGTINISGPGFPSGSKLGTIPETNGPFYYYASATGSTLAYGGTYTISSNGGTQVGPFSISGTLPTSFSVTNWDQITSINRSADLPVSWAGSGFGTVILGASGTTQTATTKHSVSISCVVAASLGTFSIPQAALAMLPAIAASTGANAGELLVTAVAGTGGTVGTPSQALTPSLVGGGQVNYGNFGAALSVVKSLSIQ